MFSIQTVIELMCMSRRINVPRHSCRATLRNMKRWL